MATQELSRNFVRKWLMKALQTDVDLDAFISDFFPAVYQRFTMGMQRDHKVSLLLDSEPDRNQIMEKLQQHQASGFPLPGGGRARAQSSIANKILLGICAALFLATGFLLAQLAENRRSVPVAAPTPPPVVPAAVHDAAPAASPLPPIIFKGPSDHLINVINSPSTKIVNGAQVNRPRVRK